MNEFLFPMPYSPSPRLKWLKENSCIVFLSMPNDPHARQWMAGFDHGEHDYIGAREFFAIECSEHGAERIGEGDTEDEAICALCVKWQVKLWNQDVL
jgi:hypothetical protein